MLAPLRRFTAALVQTVRREYVDLRRQRGRVAAVLVAVLIAAVAVVGWPIVLAAEYVPGTSFWHLRRRREAERKVAAAVDETLGDVDLADAAARSQEAAVMAPGEVLHRRATGVRVCDIQTFNGRAEIVLAALNHDTITGEDGVRTRAWYGLITQSLDPVHFDDAFRVFRDARAKDETLEVHVEAIMSPDGVAQAHRTTLLRDGQVLATAHARG